MEPGPWQNMLLGVATGTGVDMMEVVSILFMPLLFLFLVLLIFVMFLTYMHGQFKPSAEPSWLAYAALVKQMSQIQAFLPVY